MSSKGKAGGRGPTANDRDPYGINPAFGVAFEKATKEARESLRVLKSTPGDPKWPSPSKAELAQNLSNGPIEFRLAFWLEQAKGLAGYSHTAKHLLSQMEFALSRKQFDEVTVIIEELRGEILDTIMPLDPIDKRNRIENNTHSILDTFLGIIGELKPLHNPVTIGVPDISGTKDEGLLNEPLRSLLNSWGVPEHLHKETAADFERFAKARAKAALRPKWDERGKYAELKDLSSPAFLKRVYADEIATDGSIRKEAVRKIDPKLIAAVETYISAREARRQDMGDAAGLCLIAGVRTHPKRASLV